MRDEVVHGIIIGHRGKLAIIKCPESGRFYEGDPRLAFVRDIDRDKCLKEFDRLKLRRV